MARFAPPPDTSPLPRPATRWMRLFLAGMLLFIFVLHIGLMLNLYSLIKTMF